MKKIIISAIALLITSSILACHVISPGCRANEYKFAKIEAISLDGQELSSTILEFRK